MINISQLVGACIIILVLDQVGRRKLAIFGGIGMMVSSLSLYNLFLILTAADPTRNSCRPCGSVQHLLAQSSRPCLVRSRSDLYLRSHVLSQLWTFGIDPSG